MSAFIMVSSGYNYGGGGPPLQGPFTSMELGC